MPLDGHSYLISQGWSGHGTGLRQDSIIRPLAIPQKRTLSGLGKDRDEAFPFWDHLFSVAAKTIQVKLSKDDGDDSSDTDSPESPATNQLERTTTGILSNQAPKRGTPASASGSATPTITSSTLHSTTVPSNNLLVTAKREAAKRSLYSRFFRGPILGPDTSETVSATSSPSERKSSNTKREEDAPWNGIGDNDLGNGRSSRTPMAIAKAKMVTASDATLPVVVDPRATGKKRKRGSSTVPNEGQASKEVEGKMKKKESKEERQKRKEKKRKEKAEKKERKEKRKEEKKQRSDRCALSKEVDEPGVKKSKKRKRSEDTSTPAKSLPDSGSQTFEMRPTLDPALKKEKKNLEEEIDLDEMTPGEAGKSERKKAKKLAAQILVPSQDEVEVGMTPTPTVVPKKKKKRRKPTE